MSSKTNNINSRRDFIEIGLKAVLSSGITSMILLPSCKEKNEDEEKKVSPPEDLMQEHGVLNRILLIYDCVKTQLINKESLQSDILLSSANIIRTFVEDYHEKQEETYLFPRFEKAGQLTGLVAVLRQQHNAGRIITDRIIELCKIKTLNDIENQKLIRLITAFNTMYRPHEAREDTVLFPAFRKIVSQNEYDSLGEGFEKNEQKLFGKGGFEMIVDKVATIEKQLGIYELAKFSPEI